MTNRSRSRVVVLLVLVLAFAAACGDDTGVATDDGEPPSTAPGDADVAVQVTVAGGFVPVDVALTTVPVLTLLHDGTVITPAPTTMIYPGPAITPMQAGTVSPDDVAALLEQARDSGLLGEPLDFGRPPVADAPTTTVTIRADGRTVRHEAYALDEFAPGGDASGVDETAAENRRVLREFVDAANALVTGDEPWIPSTIAVTVVGPYAADADAGEQQPVDWPLAAAPDTEGQYPCTVVSGADATTLLEALRGANARTPWIVEGEELALAFRPVVPGDEGCA